MICSNGWLYNSNIIFYVYVCVYKYCTECVYNHRSEEAAHHMQRAVTMHTRLVPIQPGTRVYIHLEGIWNGLSITTGIPVRTVDRWVDVQPVEEQIGSVRKLQDVTATWKVLTSTRSVFQRIHENNVNLIYYDYYYYNYIASSI